MEFGRMMYVILVVVVTISILALFVSRTFQTDNVELRILSNRVLYESSMQDGFGRVVVGTMDESLKNGGELDSKIKYVHEERSGAVMTVGGKVKIYYSKKWYDLLLPRANAGFDATKTGQNAYVIHDGQPKIARIEAVR